MSRGISWRQRWMLESIQRRQDKEQGKPVAWRHINYGPTSNEGKPDYFSARKQWNLEQAMRRALRSLEQRGLVELGRYVFQPYADVVGLGGPSIIWVCRPSDDHVPGESKIMTGAKITEAGREAIRKSESAR